jgi:hypothetical protein
MKRLFEKKFWIAGALLIPLAAPSLSPRCLASTLPQPAARFIHFFERSSGAEKLGSGKVGMWERFVYSLIFATSAPAGTPSTSSSRPS